MFFFSFQNRVIIHEVHKDGAADKDGRLKPGDFIVSVDGKAMLECTHKDALRALRVTKDKVRNPKYLTKRLLSSTLRHQ